jgi:SAM-dependent methyltransferase
MWPNPCEPFEESSYLAANPDVARAVAANTFSSGLNHFIAIGHREQRPGVDPATRVRIGRWLDAGGALPVPTSVLRHRVHGSQDEQSFLKVGRVVSMNLLSTLRAVDAPWREASAVLDFGCGSGRVARYMATAAPLRMFGCDIDAEAIAWNQQHLGRIGEFAVNPHWPPLPYSDHAFDLVYAVSVFTHLPEDMEEAWLAELQRVTRPGGTLLLTSHGPWLIPEAAVAVRETLARTGFAFKQGGGTQGLPDFYHTSFHTEDKVRRSWSRWFDVVRFVPRGLNRHQDLVALRARSRA